jgi:hypothetical protein
MPVLRYGNVVHRGRILGEIFNIELPSGERFHTELLPTGNKLQERGKIRKFYQDENVQAGESVLLTEITPGRWQLKKLIRYRRVARVA